MKKSEFIWLILRLIGIICIYLAITNLVALFANIFTFMEVPELISKSFGILFQQITLIVIQGLLGIYLIRDGSHFFGLLNKEDHQSALDQELKEISLNLDEKQNS